MNYVTKHNITSWPAGKLVRRKFVKKGHTVHHREDVINEISVIKKGWVKVIDYDANGQEKILLLLHEGDILPVIWREGVMSQLHYWYEAVTEVEIETISKGDLELELEKNPELTHELFRYTQSMLHELLLRIETIEVSSAKTRLARSLYYVASKSSSADSGFVVSDLRLTQSIMASLTGITRETVANLVSELEADEYIKKNDGKLLINMEIREIV